MGSKCNLGDRGTHWGNIRVILGLYSTPRLQYQTCAPRYTCLLGMSSIRGGTACYVSMKGSRMHRRMGIHVKQLMYKFMYRLRLTSDVQA